MPLSSTTINKDEVWFGESLKGDVVLYIECSKINQFTTLFLTLDELRELRTQVNKQIMLKTFKKQN